ncbi:DUF5313 domain-containing protein [Tsukamurella soli]|uniref:DUF5313 domain-containing protein n=1 Tax=Tsukamurella soli TaxID=644556 RepID=A0ABP8J7V1_9ACTN
MTPEIHTPNPLRYIAFVYGAALPDHNREWVRHTLTCDTWVVRHLIRGQLALVPVYAILLAIPGPLGLRCATVLLGVFVVLFYNVVYMRQNRARRLQRSGLDPNLENPRVLARRERVRAAYEQLHPHAG